MPLQVDHTIVPAYDRVKSAEFIARIVGLKYEGPWGHFAPVRVNDTPDAGLRRLGQPSAPVTTPSLPLTTSSTPSCNASRKRMWSSAAAPATRTDGEITHLHQGRGFYFECENGHVWELITHTYVTV